MPSNLTELQAILYSGALSYGSWTRLFEEELRRYLNVEDVIATNSFNAAMLVLITTLNLKPGDEIIASPMSCLASSQPFLNKGLIVNWADIDPNTGTLDPDFLRQIITKNTKAIFHNHHCGIPGYIEEVNRIGKEFGLYVIDDCIEAFGSEYDGKVIGATGSDASVYSFQTVRLPNTIDGGAISFTSSILMERARLIRDYGVDRTKFRDEQNEISEHYDVSMEGYGAMMSDFNGYIGYTQMSDINSLISKQRENATAWINYINDKHPGLKVVAANRNINPNFWVFNILTERKDMMMQFFRSLGYYASGVHINTNLYSAFGAYKELKGVESFAERHLALPCGWWINEMFIE